MSDEKTLYQGRFLRLVQCGRWEYVQRSNARCGVVVVAVTPDGRVLMVDQYRAPLRKRVIEMPAGLVGDDAGGEDEPVERAALRELWEETGWRAERVEWLTEGPPSPGLASEQLVFCRAHGLAPDGPGGGDEFEDIRVHAVPAAGFTAWLAERREAGCLIDPKVYTGLFFIRDLIG